MGTYVFKILNGAQMGTYVFKILNGGGGGGKRGAQTSAGGNVPPPPHSYATVRQIMTVMMVYDFDYLTPWIPIMNLV